MELHQIESTLTNNFPFQLTEGQTQAVSAISRLLTTAATNPLLILKGYAGTGKTSMVISLVKSLPQFNTKFVLLAPTGRAAKVLMSYTRHFASTIHRKIYVANKGLGGLQYYTLAPNKHTNTLFIVDEASMISGQADSELKINSLLDDLLQYVYCGDNCKILFIGDIAQLPPVGTNLSPALNARELKHFYDLKVGEIELTEVMRQNLDSGVLYNATNLRSILNKSEQFLFKLDTFEDIFSITGELLEDELNDAYSKYGDDEVIIITRSNKRANLFNQHVRARIKWHEGKLEAGDRLMAVKNNYFWLSNKSTAGFIANGDAIRVLSIQKFEEKYGFHFADVTIELCDYPNEESIDVKLLLDAISVEAPSLNAKTMKQLYYELMENEYLDIHHKKDRHHKVINDPYYNAIQVKFAYAITCHKSQGGQWKAVFVEQGFITEDMINEEYYRWLYTAITRSREKLWLVNFHPRFFEA